MLTVIFMILGYLIIGGIVAGILDYGDIMEPASLGGILWPMTILAFILWVTIRAIGKITYSVMERLCEIIEDRKKRN